ncbi:hypothetical protein [Haloactinomyces albus]|uniref:DUF320 domain-containing protein n=1 Tax=Haloactinomyces albus TaxID=1352928 RepID=A0AAE3ZBR8_9ACTN|nr:hypothetical protein [Haloactinomyces albus]MDR7300619.1 hypothetical protein [Haloactinomyces albus]
MRTSARLVGVAAVTAGMMAMGAPAFASVPSFEDIRSQVAENEGGDGGDGGIGVNLCGLVPISVLGENKVACSAGNGGDGGDADSDQKQVEDNGNGYGKDKHYQDYENNKGKNGDNGKGHALGGLGGLLG